MSLQLHWQELKAICFEFKRTTPDTMHTCCGCNHITTVIPYVWTKPEPCLPAKAAYALDVNEE